MLVVVMLTEHPLSRHDTLLMFLVPIYPKLDVLHRFQ
jgi:hypothetical protein